MTMQKIFIAGELTDVLLTEIPIDDIELDAKNPRIGLQADMGSGPMDQEEIKFFLERKNVVAFEKLKASLKENKGIINPVWVMNIGQKYRILEGNTRLVIYQQLRDSEKDGDKYYSKIKAYVITGEVDESKADFIRLTAHLRGETPWDAYEKSRYLFMLSEKGYSTDKLEKLTKLKKSDIQNSIHAFKLMSEQFLPKFGKDPSDIFKFSYFVEFVKDKKLQDIMEGNGLKDTNFCTWVGKNKLKRARDVRDLKNILSDPVAKDLFIKKGYDKAIEKISITDPSAVRGIYSDIEDLIDDLGTKITPNDIIEMKGHKSDERKKLLRQLQLKLDSILELIE
ncbi:ParB N-terminal domain-containing protein [Methanococcoides sp. SA1]|nr:ParB N-terminal domain-containing protein [Methanococcoides sp. SA1]